MSNPRLPIPGQDDGIWGEILNEFLLVGHNSDGTNKVDPANTPVTSVNGQTGVVSISKSDIGLSSVDNTNDANKPVSVAMQNSLNQKADASTLSAVATSGQYSDLINKPIVPNSASLVYLSGAQQISGEKDFIGILKASGSVVVTTDDTRLTNARQPLDDSVSTAKLQDGSVNEAKLLISNTPTEDDFLKWDGTNFVWQAEVAPAALTKADIGLGNVDNTSDVDKPVSTATQTALDTKAATSDSRFTDQRTPSDNSVSTAKVQDSSISEPKLAISNSPASGNFLAWDGTDLKWQDQAGGAVSTVSGRTGDVTLTKADVGLSNADNTSDANKPVSTAVQTQLDLKVAADDVRLTDQRTPSDDSVSTGKIQDSAITEPKLSISNSPVNGNFLAWDGTNFTWQNQAASAVASVSGRTGAVTLTKADVGLSSVDDTNDADKPVSTATQTVLDTKAATNDSRFTDQRTPSDNSVSTAKVQDSSITEPKLAIANSPTTGNFLAWDGTSLNWQDQLDSAVSSVSGRTGDITLTKADVGLSNADNTNDASKPVSTATQTSLDAKVAKSGDTMTGALVLPGDPTDPKHATTKEYVDAQLGSGQQNLIIGTSAPTPATGDQVLWLNTTGGNVTLNLVTGD